MFNTVYPGDNLEIMRKYLPLNSIDLIYLDPPFNSQQTLYHNSIKAFEDHWQWTDQVEIAYSQIIARGGRLADVLRGFRLILGECDILAYFVMMCPRLVEMYRVLKPTGTMYLHVDSHANSYMKILCDVIFENRFINEIVWQRSKARMPITKIYKRGHDTLLLYAKSNKYTFNPQYKPLAKQTLSHYRYSDERGKFRLVPLLVSGKRSQRVSETWRGIDPNVHNSHWVTIPENLEQYYQDHRIQFTKRGIPQLRYYLETNKGVPINDIWDDLPAVGSTSKEATGYPTQKPLRLLERIIKTSSNPGDLVLDPFVGSGTTLLAAEKQGRQWIGIDNSPIAIKIIEKRLFNKIIEIPNRGEPLEAGVKI